MGQCEETDTEGIPAFEKRFACFALCHSGHWNLLPGRPFLVRAVLPHDDCFAPSLSGLRDDPGSLAGLVREVGEGLEPAASGIWMDRPGELVWSPPLSIGPDRAFQMDAGLPGADSAGDARIVLLEGGSRLSGGA